ncbi:MAG TPA: DinB family protein [Pirellulaceae bacterium]|jgi:uncharacterized damage-inducible protein DinB|nr:DinB family protein [Pirellulaceae bacterium]
MTELSYMQAMQHDDGSLSAAKLIDRYEQGVEELRGLVAGLSGEQAKARPVEGKWTPLELVNHLADTETFFSERIARTIALDRPLLLGVDEQPYAERLQYQSLDLEDAVAVVVALRKRTASVLRLQSDDAWSRTAVHSESGLLTLRQLVFNPTRHLRHHLRFLAEKRAALGL